MSEVSGKKRKNLTSPPSEGSISKFFKSCEKPPKKSHVLKDDDDDDVVIVNKDKEKNKTEKANNAVQTAPSKVAGKLDAFKSSQSLTPDHQKNGASKSDKTTNGKSEKTKSENTKSDSTKSKPMKNKTTKSDAGKNEKAEEIASSTEGEAIIDRGIMFSELKSKSVNKKVSFTALEQQVVAIKLKNMDVLLFVEVGYRYRFFGEDAEIASKELDINLNLDHNFLNASIPVHRLTVHVSRLVEKGFKVGVVKQMETAALKAAGDNKSAPFTRKLANVYTKATFIDREENEESTSEISTGRYVISICEVIVEKEQPYIGLYCVNPTSGDIACMNLDVDENIISKLQTVFCALKPSEVLLQKQVNNKKMEEYIRRYCKADEARIEQLEPSEDISITEEQLKKKLGADFKCGSIVKCIALMNTYLKGFDLQNILLSLRNYRPYSLQRNCMYLDGATIKNLELLENSFDKTIKGSLLWIVDHTNTMFGKRLLKRWLVQPLIKIKQINRRLDAVSELVDHSDSIAIKEIKKNFKGCLDIEKSLTGIFYRNITPDKFIKTMEALSKLNALLVSHAEELNLNFKSSLLQSVFCKIPKLLGTDVDDVLGSLDKEAAAAKGNNKDKLFRNLDDYPRIARCKELIKNIEERLEEHKDTDVRKILGGPVDYKCVSGGEYLIEVKNKELNKVPKSWVKVSSTKQVARFRPLYVEEQYKKLCQTREKLKIVADAAWESFLNDFSDMYDFCRKAVQKFAELDCLMSLATVAMQSDHCRPVFDEDSNTIEITDGRHPVLSALLPENTQYVANNITLGGDHKAMIVSGPNMGGKSSYIRQVAINCILAQIGSYIPATSAKFCALDGVYTRMGSSDDIAKGKSTFMVELEEASMIIREATSKSLVILDELGRGTSTYDGMAIAFATLKFFIEEAKSFTLFVTHYPMLSEFERLYPNQISNHHMAFMSAADAHMEQDNDDSLKDESTEEKPDVSAVEAIVFLYKLIKGAAKKSYGLNVARLAGIPDKILLKASQKSSAMENEVQQRVDNIETLKSLLSSENSVDTLKGLVRNG